MTERMFLPNHFEKHEDVIFKKVRKFMLGYKLLEEFLSLGVDPNDEESLEFFSNLYKDMAPLLTEITCYVINNGYSGKRKRVDYGIILSQKILGLLKIFHLRYLASITSQDPISDPRWYQQSDKSNQIILEEISRYFEQMYSFEFEG